MIVIVDDDRSVRVATESLVRSFGFRAKSFGSAEEFLISPEINQASCIITDLQMPGISGLELQSDLHDRQNRTPLIFITAFPEEGIKRQAIDAGAYGFLTKPFDADELKECITRALGVGAG
jgi:FixJ family two-component response regulator